MQLPQPLHVALSSWLNVIGGWKQVMLADCGVQGEVSLLVKKTGE